MKSDQNAEQVSVDSTGSIASHIEIPVKVWCAENHGYRAYPELNISIENETASKYNLPTVITLGYHKASIAFRLLSRKKPKVQYDSYIYGLTFETTLSIDEFRLLEWLNSKKIRITKAIFEEIADDNLSIHGIKLVLAQAIARQTWFKEVLTVLGLKKELKMTQ